MTVKDPTLWDEHSQRLLTASPVNKTFARMHGELQLIFDQLFFNKKNISPAIIKNKYLGRSEESPYLNAYMDKFLEERIKGNPDLSDGTVKNYRATINHITDFLGTIPRSRIFVSQIDEGFIRKLDRFLIESPANGKGTLRRNTVNKYHTKFKALLTVATKEGFIEKCPYSFFKLKNEATGRTFLTEKELSILQKHSLGENASLIRVRDIFMFSVYTGLRFNDAINLKSVNIEFDGKKHWVVLRMQKTKEPLRIPMLKKAIDI
ncbi:MAG TPA: site-specific integrase, partial [Candidatus Brocadiales bacterium]|nr:site-specific integrase [Candidatus Brocadiales bacterium]